VATQDIGQVVEDPIHDTVSLTESSGNVRLKRTRIFLVPGAVLATAALWFWGTGLHPVWWLTWLAPLPVLLVSPKLGRGRGFWLPALAWFLGSLNLWHYMTREIALPLPIVFLASAVPACFFGLAVLLFRRFILRGALWRAALVFPASWVTYEYLNAIISPHSTFGSLGYTQMDFLPVLQVASLVGIWGISFCLFLLPSTMAAALRPRSDATKKIRLATAVGLFLAAVIGYGAWRLMSAPAIDHWVRVGLIATGADTTFPHEDGAGLHLLRLYSEKAGELAAEGARVIVMPEKIALVSDRVILQVDAIYEASSARAGTDMVVGLDRGTMTKRHNEARLYSSTGGPAAIYDKHHMVPGLEDADQPGTAITTLEKPSGVWGIQICKDMDFPALSRQYGAKGVGLLLVPAWDFTMDGWLHSRMAVTRGVESGFTVARAAKQGMLTASDNRGRILAQQDTADMRFAYLLANAPVQHSDTLYVRWGDWFAWLNACGLLVLLFSTPWRMRFRS